jgi:hypothetical protein
VVVSSSQNPPSNGESAAKIRYRFMPYPRAPGKHTDFPSTKKRGHVGQLDLNMVRQ